MANTLENTLQKIGDTVEMIFNQNGVSKATLQNHPSKGQTCLEAYGMVVRNIHLNRNEWSKDMQYTKSLVNSEYTIQTEFKIS